MNRSHGILSYLPPELMELIFGNIDKETVESFLSVNLLISLRVKLAVQRILGSNPIPVSFLLQFPNLRCVDSLILVRDERELDYFCSLCLSSASVSLDPYSSLIGKLAKIPLEMGTNYHFWYNGYNFLSLQDGWLEMDSVINYAITRQHSEFDCLQQPNDPCLTMLPFNGVVMHSNHEPWYLPQFREKISRLGLRSSSCSGSPDNFLREGDRVNLHLRWIVKVLQTPGVDISELVEISGSRRRVAIDVLLNSLSGPIYSVTHFGIPISPNKVESLLNLFPNVQKLFLSTISPTVGYIIDNHRDDHALETIRKRQKEERRIRHDLFAKYPYVEFHWLD